MNALLNWIDTLVKMGIIVCLFAAPPNLFRSFIGVVAVASLVLYGADLIRYRHSGARFVMNVGDLSRRVHVQSPR